MNIVSGYKLIDNMTGEIYDAEIRLHKSTGEHWMKIYQVAHNAVILKLSQGNSFKVKDTLLNIAKYQNQIPTQLKVAAIMNIKQSQLSRAYKELTQAGFLYKKEGVYTINPCVAWKGTEKDREQAIRDYYNVTKGSENAKTW